MLPHFRWRNEKENLTQLQKVKATLSIIDFYVD